MKFVKIAGKKSITKSGKKGNMDKFIHSRVKRKGRR
jgi:hypothetical protein